MNDFCFIQKSVNEFEMEKAIQKQMAFLKNDSIKWYSVYSVNPKAFLTASTISSFSQVKSSTSISFLPE